MSYEKQKVYSSQDATPRMRRIAAEKRAVLARRHIIISAIAGGILLGLLILCLSFL